MPSLLLTPPAVEPLSLAETRAWLRLDTTDEDATLAALITAARNVVEQAAQRLLIRQSWRVTLDSWPQDGLVRLPLAPVVSVEAVRVRGVSGAAVGLPGTAYALEAGREPALLALVAAVPQPGVARGGIEIDLICGHADSAGGVPEPLRQAMRMLVARWFENRGEEANAGLPPDVALLVAPYRRPRL